MLYSASHVAWLPGVARSQALLVLYVTLPQNSGSLMFMLRVKILSVRDRH